MHKRNAFPKHILTIAAFFILSFNLYQPEVPLSYNFTNPISLKMYMASFYPKNGKRFGLNDPKKPIIVLDFGHYKDMRCTPSDCKIKELSMIANYNYKIQDPVWTQLTSKMMYIHNKVCNWDCKGNLTLSSIFHSVTLLCR